MTRTATLDDLSAIQAMAQPVRMAILQALREPGSATSVAKALGQPRQNINYHLKELEKAGLVRPAGERRKGALTEQLFQAAAHAFLVSPRIGWTVERQVATLRDQAALAGLVDLGERVRRDAAELLDRAAFDGEAIASAVVEAEVAFASPADRSAFMTEYLEALGPLLKKYGGHRRPGDGYRVALAVYPDPSDEGMLQ